MKRWTLMLLVMGSFMSGFYFDRWLHRPIVLQFHVVHAPTTSI